jgi:hypothetical protein
LRAIAFETGELADHDTKDLVDEHDEDGGSDTECVDESIDGFVVLAGLLLEDFDL